MMLRKISKLFSLPNGSLYDGWRGKTLLYIWIRGPRVCSLINSENKTPSTSSLQLLEEASIRIQYSIEL